MEDQYENLSHTKWQCKYHVIFIPKCRRRRLFGVVRRELGAVFRRLAEQKGCKVHEGHVMPDHVHMLISIPPKLAVSSVVGYIKGKSAIHIARNFGGRQRNFTGENFWARGYFCVTAGELTKEMIREYLEHHFERDPNDGFDIDS